jgi:hypothetical protein
MTESRTESSQPSLVIPLTDKDEPNLPNDCKDAALPNEASDHTLNLPFRLNADSTLKFEPKFTRPATDNASSRSTLPLTDRPVAPIAANPRVESVLPPITSLKTETPPPMFSESAIDRELPNLTNERTLADDPNADDPATEKSLETCKLCLTDKELVKDPQAASEKEPCDTILPDTERLDPNKPTPRTVSALPTVVAP